MVKITDPSVQSFEREHIKTVREVAPECTLFLKKDGTFPLTEVCRIAAYGSGVRKTVRGGTGSGDVNVRHFVTIEEGLKNAGFTIISEPWLDAYDNVLAESRKAFIQRLKKEALELNISPAMYSMGKIMPEPEYELPLDMSADVGMYVLARNSGEGSDRSSEAGDIELTDVEIRDITKLNEEYEKFILVLNTGGMVNLKPVEHVKNIFLLGQLGTPAGDVLADVLTGRSYPSGKLAMTWAPLEDYPSTEGFGEWDDTLYKEGIYVGYRYFDSVKKRPSYPFGFGISYTDFSIAPKAFEINGSMVSVTTAVCNTGSYVGKEVVQVYYSAPGGYLDKPFQELIAFSKTKELQPGEGTLVTMTFDAADMASYDSEHASWILEKGKYIIRAGNSSRDTKAVGTVSVNEDIVITKLKNICPGCGFEDMKVICDTAVETADIKEVILTKNDFSVKKTKYSGRMTEVKEGNGCTWEQVRSGECTLDDFVAGLSTELLAYVCMGQFEENSGMHTMVGSSGISVAGAAGETTARLSELGVPTLVMADGPAGLRLCKEYKIVKGAVKGLDNPLAAYLEFAEPEQLEQLAAMMPKPDKEELEAPVHYTYCTAIPIGTDIAQSFSMEAASAFGDVVGKEMEMFGVHLWLAPAMNIQRSPLCGRNFEYYSEDPYLTGKIAVAITNAVQRHKGCGTTIKHFAANNQETNRLGSNSVLSERALREIYLKGFEICIKDSHPEALMTSYNLVNGEHTCNSRDLVTHVLRDEWGYEGVVMTDWYAADDMMVKVNMRKNKNMPGYASGCIYAGNDITMPGIPDEFEDILGAVGAAEGIYPITKADLQLTAKHVLASIFRLTEQ